MILTPQTPFTNAVYLTLENTPQSTTSPETTASTSSHGVKTVTTSSFHLLGPWSNPSPTVSLAASNAKSKPSQKASHSSVDITASTSRPNMMWNGTISMFHSTATPKAGTDSQSTPSSS